MVGLSELILPILIAACSVFFASSIIWMMLPYHKADIQFLKDKESGLTEKLKELSIKPGLYMFPGCDTSDLKTEKGLERWNAGPWGVITIYPGKPNFGMNLAKTFTTFAIITIMIAYITGVALPAGTDYMRVFRVACTAGIMAHCMGSLVNDFFLGKPNRFIITSLIDGVVYALITAGILASMWPGVASPDSILIIDP